MNKLLSDEMKEISSGLLSKTENPVPEEYFDKLPDQILDRHRREKGDSNPVVFGIRKMIAAAAMVCGICVTVVMYSGQEQGVSGGHELTDTEVYDYILIHLDEFETLLEEPVHLAEQSDFPILEPEAMEEYLLEELDGRDVNVIF